MTRSPVRLTASAGIRSRSVGNRGPSPPLLKLKNAGGLRCVFLPLPPAAACGECSPATAEREREPLISGVLGQPMADHTHERSMSRVHRSSAL